MAYKLDATNRVIQRKFLLIVINLARWLCLRTCLVQSTTYLAVTLLLI
jgi:hypothetical protein